MGGWVDGWVGGWVGGRASEQRHVMLLGAGEPLDDHGAQLLRLAPQRARRECGQPPRVEGQLARALPMEAARPCARGRVLSADGAVEAQRQEAAQQQLTRVEPLRSVGEDADGALLPLRREHQLRLELLLALLPQHRRRRRAVLQRSLELGVHPPFARVGLAPQVRLRRVRVQRVQRDASRALCAHRVHARSACLSDAVEALSEELDGGVVLLLLLGEGDSQVDQHRDLAARLGRDRRGRRIVAGAGHGGGRATSR